MQIINIPNIEQAKKEIRNSKTKPIIVKAQNDEFNRKILEYGKFDILVGIETEKRKNTLRQLDSGLNHVLGKIASKNNIIIGIDLEEISRLKEEEKANALAKIMQNIRICRKAKTRLIILNAEDKKNAFHFLISLGASTQQAKDAVYLANLLILISSDIIN